MSNTSNLPRYHVKVKAGSDENPIWIKVGAAFAIENGFAINLDAQPIGGRMYLFEPKETRAAPAAPRPRAK